MFAARFSVNHLKDVLTSTYEPFPKAGNRPAWEALPESLKRSLIKEGEAYLGHAWPVLTATGFLEFTRTGNRSRFEHLSFSRRRALATLVVAECIESNGRFLDDIINGVWHICEESFWGVPATVYMQGNASLATPNAVPNPLPDVTDPVVDLFAGETGGLLAFVHYLLGERLDTVTPLVSARIRHEIKRRIIDPYLERDDFWWMGFTKRNVNNWNPWCNSNCLIAGLLIEEDQDRRVRLVEKALRSLDYFVGSYRPDGGCDEGTSYWSRAGGSLFDCLELLYGASNGQIDFYDEPLIKEIGRFLYRSFIADDYYINFADGSARVNIPAELVYLYGKRIGDERLAQLGAFAHRTALADGAAPRLDSIYRLLRGVFLYSELESAPAEPPYVQDVWLADIQVMAARESAAREGFFVAAKGGHNAESHNHNDVGHFIVYLGGRPVLVDVGVETYTAKTFSRDRYEIWTMQSGYHNVPRVRGVEQRPGLQFKASHVAYRANDSVAELSLELAESYPQEAGIRSWARTVRLKRDEQALVEVVDTFALDEPTADVSVMLMTPHRPDISISGTIGLGASATLRYDASKVSAASERIEIEDERLRTVWGDELFRIILTATKAVASDTWTLRIEKKG